MMRWFALAVAAAGCVAPASACTIWTYSTPYWPEAKPQAGEIALEVEYLGQAKQPKDKAGIEQVYRFRVKSVQGGSFKGDEVRIVDQPLCNFPVIEGFAYPRTWLMGKIDAKANGGVPVIFPRQRQSCGNSTANKDNRVELVCADKLPPIPAIKGAKPH